MSPHQIIAHYRIISKLGEGGMGAVYRATDTKLNRDVAIKVLPESFAEDVFRMQRFEREAQVLASLNHPNIAAIYGIEQGAIVMELVEGEDLKGPLPIDTAVQYARHIAAALEAAHEKGIVHRDLKPANIKVTSEGVVKLLDFGLAKAGEDAAATAGSHAPTMSPTLSLAMTQAGMILGTAAYMSPEQARGKPVDKRADIWAFGVVLFELLTGKQLFASGDTVTDIIAAVVTREPDWTALPPSTPAHVRRLLERCLRKDPKVRLRDIGEARITLEEPPTAAASPSPRVRPWGWIAAAVLAVAVAAMALTMRRTPASPLRTMLRFEADELMSSSRTLALSPDGSRVVIDVATADGGRQLAVRALDQPKVTPLPGTESATNAVFSPDGEWLAFESTGKLRKLRLQGGASIVICDSPSSLGLAWGDDGNLFFVPGIRSVVMRVSSDGGGAPQPATKFDASRQEATHRFPWAMPGGKVLLYTAAPRGGLYDEADIVATDVSNGRATLLHHGGFHPSYVARQDGQGYLLFLREATLYALPMDPAKLTVREPPIPIVQGVASSATSALAQVVVSRNGLLAYQGGSNNNSLVIPTWIDAAGKAQPLHLPPGTYSAPRISPDGKRVLYRLSTGSALDLWVYDLAGASASKLTFTGDTVTADWSHDGRHVLYTVASAAHGAWWVRADGSAPPLDLGFSLGGGFAGFTPDGHQSVTAFNGGSRVDLARVSWQDPGSDDPHPGKLEPWLSGPVDSQFPALSPDGKWVAYASDEMAGRNQIYVRPFPGPGGKWQVSTDGGRFPEWSPAGDELFYTNLNANLMAVHYKVKGEAFIRGEERVKFPHPISILFSLRNYSTAPDGKQFVALLAPQQPENSPPPRLTFLVNFVDELDRRFAPLTGNR